VTNATTLEISNKYGNIHLNTWNKDSVRINAEIEAHASSDERLLKMLRGIEININEVNYLIKAETSYTQSINMIFESFKGLTDKLIPYDSRIQVNYEVYLPEYLNLRIINRYGDTFMESCSGNFSLNLSNGSFKAGTLNNISEFVIAFGDATVNSIGSGKINASFSELTIGEAAELSVSSVSSRFDIPVVENLNTESRRDKFFIGKIGSLKGNAYFTGYRIDNLSGEINLVTKYGSLNIDNIDRSFGLLTLNTSYTEIALNFDPDASYNLDLRHTNTYVVTPRSDEIEEKVLNQEKKEYMTYGKKGKNPGSNKVAITAIRGSIYIK